MIDERCFLSTVVADVLVEEVMQQVWKGVALENLGRMVPRLTREEALETLDAFVKLCFTETYRGGGAIVLDKDPVPALMDTLAAGKMGSEQAGNRQVVQLNTKTDRSENASKLGNTTRSKKTVHSSKFSENVTEKHRNPTQSFLISLAPSQELQDDSLQNLRKVESDRKADQTRMRKALEQRLKQRQQTALHNQKFLREKKTFTFDYEGGYSGVNPPKLADQSVRKMKQQLSQPSIMSENKIQPQLKTINNEKIKANQTKNSKLATLDKPVFSGKSFSIVEALDDASKVSSGVKITQIRGSNNSVIRQGKTKKLQGVMAYRLKQFQNIAKDNNFKEFIQSDRKIKTIEVSADRPLHREEPQTITQKTARVISRSEKRSESSVSISDNKVVKQALGRGLPFIRTKGLRFNDLGSTMKSFQANAADDHKKSKHRSSKIHIRDIDLFEQAFLC